MKKIITYMVYIFLVFSLIAEARNALLIANEDYKNCSSLPNPVKEVRELEKVLQQLNFSVTILENGTRDQMEDALYAFQTKLEKSSGIGFFLYTGHGMQVSGKNYLIPVEANVPDESRMATRTVDLDEVMASMKGDTNIVILDACRTNPFKYKAGKELSQGLALSENKPKNSIIIYSAQPNKVAWDGVFTPILTKKLSEKKEFGAILRDVRKEVYEKTNGEQSPGEYNELITEVYLAGKTSSEPVQPVESNTPELYTPPSVEENVPPETNDSVSNSDADTSDNLNISIDSFGLFFNISINLNSLLTTMFSKPYKEEVASRISVFKTDIIWAGFNKYRRESSFLGMLGSSISLNPIETEDFTFGIINAFIGYRMTELLIYTGLGFGIKKTSVNLDVSKVYKSNTEKESTSRFDFFLCINLIRSELKINESLDFVASYAIEFIPNDLSFQHLLSFGIGHNFSRW